jgi:hypothetical protein
MTPDERSPHRWMRAWETQMAEAGWSHARLSLHRTPEGALLEDTIVTYTWCYDIDATMAGTPGAPQEAWDAAHRAFVAIEYLRPAIVQPSIMLMMMLSGDQPVP